MIATTLPRALTRALILTRTTATVLGLALLLGWPAGGPAPAAAIDGPPSAVATTITLTYTHPTQTVPACADMFTLRSTVVAADGTQPSGRITFFRNGQEITSTAVHSGSYIAPWLPVSCSEGVDVWTATFDDTSGVYAASQADPLALEVVRRTQTVALAAPPISWGQPLRIEATLTAQPWDPGGTVVIVVDGDEVFRGHTNHLTASVQTEVRGLEPGDHVVTAHVVGTALTYPSAPASVTVPVRPIHGTFHVIAPTRVEDTRNPLVQFCGAPWPVCDFKPLAAGSTLRTPITSTPWGIATPMVGTGAVAVALNVTTTQASGPGYIAVHAGDRPVPLASTGNLWPGHDVATMTMTKIGAYGSTAAYVSTRTHLVADAVGYWTDDRTGALTQALSPRRVLDTRGGAPVGAADRKVQILGRTDVPASATAVVVNVTSTQAAGVGYVSARASGAPVDRTSALNLVPGVDRSNLAIVTLGADGAITMRSDVSLTHLVVDVVGYMSPTSGQTTGPLPPRRLLDTRQSERAPRSGDVVLQVAGRGGVPENASAAWLSVTTTGTAGPGHVVVWPGGPAPMASTSNLAPGADIAALTLVPLAPDGTITVRRNGVTHVLVDVVGAVDAAA